MSTFGVERFEGAGGSIAIKLHGGDANRLLLALERLDQQGGLDPPSRNCVNHYVLGS